MPKGVYERTKPVWNKGFRSGSLPLAFWDLVHTFRGHLLEHGNAANADVREVAGGGRSSEEESAKKPGVGDDDDE